MKRLIPVALLGTLFVVGCNQNKKNEAAANPTPPSELTQPTPAPAPMAPTYTPAPEPTVSSTPAPSARPAATAKPAAPTHTTAAKPAAASSAKPAASSAKSYVVKKGDTLSEIAKVHNTTMKKIMAINPKIKSPDKIEVGQTIKLP